MIHKPDMTDCYAFPGITDHGENIPTQVNPGMTLRDYFAGAALPGLLSQMGSDLDEDGFSVIEPIHPSIRKPDQRKLARRAYEIATAMLDVRAELYDPQDSEES